MAQEPQKEPQTWLITGCSSGFGETFVRTLIADGDYVIATGRNASTKLAHLESTGATILELDVSSPPDEIKAVIDEAWGIYPGGIDVVVNNAGYIYGAAVEELEMEELLKVHKTNFYGPFNISRAIVPYFRARNRGSFCFISSIIGWTAHVAATPYTSSKRALQGMAECLSMEMEIFAPDVKVLVVEPGYFKTDIFKKHTMVESTTETYHQFHKGVGKFMHDMIGNEPGDPERGVAAIIDLLKGRGWAAGKKVPLRLPMGSDSLEAVREKCRETLRVCDEWEGFARSTDWKAPSES